MGFGGAKITRNNADKHFSNSVRRAAEMKCQRCKKDYTDRPQGLQCSHFISRGHWSVRYDPKNALSLCAYCHNYVEGFPTHHTALWAEIHGGIYGRDETDASLNALLQRESCKSRGQYARNNIPAIAAHYKAESERLTKELELKAKGKEYDLEVRSYVATGKPLEIS